MFFEDPDSGLTLELPKGSPSVLELWRESDDALVTMLYSGETADETFLNPAEDVYHPIAPTIFMMFEGKAYLFEVKFKKYTAEGSWHDDLDRLHGYRDALGKDGAVVQEAWCLYPGAGVNGQMESTPANAAYEPEGSPAGGGLGLMAVHPTDEASWQRLERLLSRWFPDLSVVEPSFEAPSEAQVQEPEAEQPESEPSGGPWEHVADERDEEPAPLAPGYTDLEPPGASMDPGPAPEPVEEFPGAEPREAYESTGFPPGTAGEYTIPEAAEGAQTSVIEPGEVGDLGDERSQIGS